MGTKESWGACLLEKAFPMCHQLPAGLPSSSQLLTGALKKLRTIPCIVAGVNQESRCTQEPTRLVTAGNLHTQGCRAVLTTPEIMGNLTHRHPRLQHRSVPPYLCFSETSMAHDMSGRGKAGSRVMGLKPSREISHGLVSALQDGTQPSDQLWWQR